MPEPSQPADEFKIVSFKDGWQREPKTHLKVLYAAAYLVTRIAVTTWFVAKFALWTVPVFILSNIESIAVGTFMLWLGGMALIILYIMVFT